MKLILVLAMSLAFAAPSLAATTVAVDSPAVRFSPGVWVGDAGRGGGKSRNTWNVGAWVRIDWAGAGTAAVDITNPAGGKITYTIDGRVVDNLPANGRVEVKDLPDGEHQWIIYARFSPEMKRWDPAGNNRFTVTGFELPDGATPRPIARRPWIMIVGDSITEGSGAGPDGKTSSTFDYAYLVGRALDRYGYDTTSNACGWSGWLNPGDGMGDVPGYFPPNGHGRWDHIDLATSLLDADGHISGTGEPNDEPAMILFNYGTNECLHNH